MYMPWGAEARCMPLDMDITAGLYQVNVERMAQTWGETLCQTGKLSMSPSMM